MNKNEVKFRKWRNKYDYVEDQVFMFEPVGSAGSIWKTNITIDWLNMDLEDRGLIVRESCTCPAFKHNRKRCKHITAGLNNMRNNGIKFRENPELKRFWCHVCKEQADIYEAEPKCYDCRLDMKFSDNAPYWKSKNEPKKEDN